MNMLSAVSRGARSGRARALPLALLSTLLVLLAGCSEGVVEAVRAEDVPVRLVLDSSVNWGVRGDPVQAPFTILDRHGNPIDRIPDWARPQWSTDPEHLVEDSAGAPVFGASGQGQLRVRLAGLEDVAQVRIHPRILHVDLDHLYLVQSVQRLEGSVPLVEGRDAVLRVFARADQANFWSPPARMILYHGETPADSTVAELQGRYVPEDIADASLDGSWLFAVPGEHVTPGLRVLVRIHDPDPVQPLTEESALEGWLTHDLGALDIREVPPLNVRFVPIYQEHFGSLGSVSEANVGEFTHFARAVFPLDEIRTDVRAPLYSSAVSDDGSTDTAALLRELRALRVFDADPRYYYGVYRHHGTAGAGRGYVGYPVAVGFDRMTTSAGDWVPRAASTFAHELGHNFGRYHAPACNAPNADPDFPYAGGRSGVAGFDPEDWRLRSPAIHDLMGYCRPRWISDYTYEAVLQFRETWDDENGSTRPISDSAPEEDVLVIWGSVGDEGAVLEPAFRARARPVLPSGQGPYTITGLDEEGRVLFEHRFAGIEVSEGGRRDFMFALPAAGIDAERLHALRVAGPDVRLRRASTFGSAAERARQMRTTTGRTTVRQAAGATELRWDRDRYPLAVVRDAASGDVLGFARNGRYAGPVPAGGVEVLLSDGVGSVRERVVTP